MTLSTLRLGKKLTCRISRLGRWESWKRVPLRLMVSYVAPERPRRFPLRLQIEATSKCNLRCPTCPHSREKGNGQHLTEDCLSPHPKSPAVAARASGP